MRGCLSPDRILSFSSIPFQLSFLITRFRLKMASTTAATVPLVIRASFLFSGMFGIRLDGLNDQNGQPLIVQSAMPLNFTLPAIVMESTKCTENCKNQESIKVLPNTIQSQPSKNITTPENNNERIVPLQPQLTLEMLTAIASTTRKPPSGKPCGPGRCSHDEICVSWLKQTSRNPKTNRLASRRESPTMVHECLPNDGIHWTKMNPSGARLCETGKTHSIILKQSKKQCAANDKPNLKQNEEPATESCEVIWSYVCVNEKESPHSCSLRDCPFKGACIEVKTCDLRRLCYVEAICTPEFLLPNNIRQSLRKKTGK